MSETTCSACGHAVDDHIDHGDGRGPGCMRFVVADIPGGADECGCPGDFPVGECSDRADAFMALGPDPDVPVLVEWIAAVRAQPSGAVISCDTVALVVGPWIDRLAIAAGGAQ